MTRLVTGRLLRRLAYCLVPPIGVLVTLATGYWATDYYSYGFPLPWKILVASGVCPPSPLMIACYLRLATSYNWGFFALDTVFYSGIAYRPFLLPANARKFLSNEFRKSWSGLHGSLKQMWLKWRELATPFQVTALMGLVGGLYVTLTTLWLIVSSSFFYNIQQPASGSFNIVSLAGSAVIVAVSIISIGGAIALLTLPMNNDQRGILSLCVTIFSFLPVVYLGLEIFSWILQEWQFAIITVFWSILLFMTTRTLRNRPKASR